MSAQECVAQTLGLPVRSLISADIDIDITSFAEEAPKRMESGPFPAHKESGKDLIGSQREVTNLDSTTVSFRLPGEQRSSTPFPQDEEVPSS